MKKLILLGIFIIIVFNGCASTLGNKPYVNKRFKTGVFAYLLSKNYTLYTNKDGTQILLCPASNANAIYIAKGKEGWDIDFPDNCYIASKLEERQPLYIYTEPSYSYYYATIIFLGKPYFFLHFRVKPWRRANARGFYVGDKEFELILIPNIKAFQCNEKDDALFEKIYRYSSLDKLFKKDLIVLATQYKQKCNRTLKPLSKIYKYDLNLKKYQQYFPKKCDYISWSGKFDDNFHPYGKGCLTCAINTQKVLGNFPSYYKICTNINDSGMFLKGKLIAIVLGGYKEVLFNTTDNIKEKLKLLMEMAVNNSNASFSKLWNKTKKHIKELILSNPNKTSNNTTNCKLLFDKCLNYCKSKSKKGFLSNDKESCRRNCYLGESECKEGHKRNMKLFMCRGICKGVNESNGGFFGSSDYDKCVNNCINSGEF